MKKPTIRRRTRTGSLEPHINPDGTTGYRYRLRLKDGTKSFRLDAPDGLSEAEARDFVTAEQAGENKDGMLFRAVVEARRRRAATRLKPHEVETANAWLKRFLASPERSQYRDENLRVAGRWEKWIAPHIGTTAIVLVTAEHIEAVRDALDDAIRSEQITPKTAANTWAVLTTAFKAASAGKNRSLRVLTMNPCLGVPPPDRGAKKRKHWLFPNEVAGVFELKAIPLDRRRAYAVAIYTGLRPEELAELRWQDVDFDASEVNVTRSWNWRSMRVEPPKSAAGVRTLPIEPELLPLLTEMWEASNDLEALVVPWVRLTNIRNPPRLLREDLAKAGARSHILEGSATHLPIVFRTCRDTYATWSAIAGRPLAAVSRALHQKGGQGPSRDDGARCHSKKVSFNFPTSWSRKSPNCSQL